MEAEAEEKDETSKTAGVQRGTNVKEKDKCKQSRTFGRLVVPKARVSTVNVSACQLQSFPVVTTLDGDEELLSATVLILVRTLYAELHHLGDVAHEESPCLVACNAVESKNCPRSSSPGLGRADGCRHLVSVLVAEADFQLRERSLLVHNERARRVHASEGIHLATETRCNSKTR